MIPLSLFLLIWVVLMGIHLIFSMITVLQMARFGIASFGTYASTTIFVMLLLVTLLLCGGYFLTVDWTQPLMVLEGFFNTSPFLNP